MAEATLKIQPSDKFFEGIQRSWTASMSDPRTGGVTEPPRKTKKNGVKNLNGAQAISEFQIGLPGR